MFVLSLSLSLSLSHTHTRARAHTHTHEQPLANSPVLLHEHDEFVHEHVFLEGVRVYEKLIPALADSPAFETEMGTSTADGPGMGAPTVKAAVASASATATATATAKAANGPAPEEPLAKRTKLTT